MPWPSCLTLCGLVPADFPAGPSERKHLATLMQRYLLDVCHFRAGERAGVPDAPESQASPPEVAGSGALPQSPGPAPVVAVSEATVVLPDPSVQCSAAVKRNVFAWPAAFRLFVMTSSLPAHSSLAFCARGIAEWCRDHMGRNRCELCSCRRKVSSARCCSSRQLAPVRHSFWGSAPRPSGFVPENQDHVQRMPEPCAMPRYTCRCWCADPLGSASGWQAGVLGLSLRPRFTVVRPSATQGCRCQGCCAWQKRPKNLFWPTSTTNPR